MKSAHAIKGCQGVSVSIQEGRMPAMGLLVPQKVNTQAISVDTNAAIVMLR